MSVTGKGATGSWSAKGQTAKLVVIGDDVYIKADAAFFKRCASADVVQSIAGTWLKFRDNDPISKFSDATDLPSLFRALDLDERGLRARAPWTNDGVTTYRGKSVIAIHSDDDFMGAVTFYVAATGTPYPVAIVWTEDYKGDYITFDGWGKPVTLTAPSGAVSPPTACKFRLP